MRAALAALCAGALFGAGLTVSQMVDPAKVLAFLDFAGDWDPSLALLMAAAVGVTALGYRLVWRRPHPLFAARFELPTRRGLDLRLVCGAALFGLGWGLIGFCPGPAIAALARPSGWGLVFVGALVAGTLLGRSPLLRSRS